MTQAYCPVKIMVHLVPCKISDYGSFNISAILHFFFKGCMKDIYCDSPQALGQLQRAKNKNKQTMPGIQTQALLLLYPFYWVVRHIKQTDSLDILNANKLYLSFCLKDHINSPLILLNSLLPCPSWVKFAIYV